MAHKIKRNMKKDRKAVEEKLNELEYFKYADSQDVIEETFKDYQDDGRINFPWKGLNRTFGIDAELIYEGDGLESHVKGLVKLFNKYNIQLNVGECIEEFDNESSTYTKREIIINGKKYETFNVKDWGSAFDSVFLLTNQLLEENNFDGRVYGLFMDETSILIILNKEQFEYLESLIPEGSDFRPINLAKMIEEVNGEKEINFVKPEFLKEGMKIKHLKHGKGQILEIDEMGVANIKFDDGNKKILLQFAKIELDI
jgi:hypothetical protein